MGVLDLLFPPACAACDELLPRDAALCGRCATSLYPLGSACPRCAQPQETPVGIVCRSCRRTRPPFGTVIAPFRFGGELAAAIRRFKYGGQDRAGRRELARPLAMLLAPSLAGAYQKGTAIVPVPLARGRLAERGFGQAEELAHLACKRVGLPRPESLLVRVRETEEQAGLDRTGRRKNVEGAFEANPLARGARVILVDDVVTTGATAAACARALKRVGAKEIVVVALARAE
jgi:ComF family protein